jgi:hypothetical protein
MPKTKLRIDPGKVYVSWQGVSSGEYSVPAGTRLRGDHPLVQAAGAAAFVEDGTPPSEWPHPLDRVIEESDAKAKKEKPAKASPLLDRPLRDFRRCVTAVSRLDGTWNFRAGELVPAEHEAISLRPECFAEIIPRST